MSRVALTIAFLSLLAACGGAAPSDTDTTTTDATATDASDPSTTTATTTSTPETTAGSDPTTDATTDVTMSTETTDSDATTDATDSDATTDTTDTGIDDCEPTLPTFADGKAPTGALYVQAGAQPGGDGSQGAPFDTLSAALNAASAGDEVRVSGQLAEGAYTVGLQGTDAAPIWITGEPGAAIGRLTLESASHVIVQDLELIGTGDGHVLHFFFADHLMFRRLRIHDAGLGCIKGSQTSYAYVEDSELWAAGQMSSHPVLDYVGVNDGHIVRSRFHDGPETMIMLKGGTSDMLFAWNEVYDQTAPGNALSLGQATGPQFFQPIDAAFEGLRIVAYANLLHDLVGAPVAFIGCKDCAAVHNTAWATTGLQLVRFLPGAAGEQSGLTQSVPEDCRFAGNILVGGQESGASLNADAPNTGPGNVIDYNVFLKPGSLNWWGVIAQDMTHSTYDQDPQLTGGGVPQNVALVDGAGPPDLDGVPFSRHFVRDFAGACVTAPRDIGAIDVR